MRTHEVTTYTFAELSEESQERVLSDFRLFQVADIPWYDSVLETVETLADLLGFRNYKYSGFDLGRGNNFLYSGTIFADDLLTGLDKAIAEFPKMELLRETKEALAPYRSRLEYFALGQCVWAEVSPNRSSNSVIYNFDEELTEYPNIDDLLDKVGQALEALCRGMEHEAIAWLNQDYDWLTSDKCIIEMIEANDYEFLSHGELFNL